jgi:hypothetical protein
MNAKNRRKIADIRICIEKESYYVSKTIHMHFFCLNFENQKKMISYAERSAKTPQYFDTHHCKIIKIGPARSDFSVELGFRVLGFRYTSCTMFGASYTSTDSHLDCKKDCQDAATEF